MLFLLLACRDDPTALPPLVAEAPFEERVTIDALLDHLDALEAIADASAGNRSYGSEGYFGSADYIQGQLEEAGFVVTREPFTLVDWSLADASFAVDGTDESHSVFAYSASGTVEGPVTPVDVTLPPGAANSSTSGCEMSDFDGFPGGIALLQRGTCTFAVKVANAEAAGATAVLVFNEGQPGRTDVVEGVLTEQGSQVPVVGLSYAVGSALADGGTVALEVDSRFEVTEDVNVFAELEGRDPEAGVVMVGAHLDSVRAGPGINDNGSGSAFVLELALQTKAAGQPLHPVRFAWWGAEEEGLIGSSRWVYNDDGTPDYERLDALDAYLNYDMMASSNGARFVADGDCSDIVEDGCSEASGAIEALYHEWFDAHGLVSEPEPMITPTDIRWFVVEGVPSGGVFSGALELKRPALVDDQGGQANASFDVCYHQSCDRTDQINAQLYEEMAHASAYVFEQLASLPGDVGARSRVLRDVPRVLGCHEHLKLDR